MPSATNSSYCAPFACEFLAARAASVRVHVVHELRAAVPRAVGERVEVADDDVGLEPHLEQRVGATVDGDEHRLVLLDVRPQRAQVVAVVVAAHDDDRVPAADIDVERRELERLERELRFALHVLERVLGEVPQLDADHLPRVVHARFDVVDLRAARRSRSSRRRATPRRRAAR